MATLRSILTTFIFPMTKQVPVTMFLRLICSFLLLTCNFVSGTSPPTAPASSPHSPSPWAEVPPPIAPTPPVPSPAGPGTAPPGGEEEGSGSGGGSRRLSGGQKAGIAVGAFAAAGVVGLGGVVYKMRRENARRARQGYSSRYRL